MKKILSLIFILLFFISSVSAVFANEYAPKKEKILQSNEIVEKDYFATAEYVALHGTVNGDVYVAGGNILIDGTVNGDIIAIGGQIVIEAEKVNNIRILGGTIVINSKEVLGNVTLGGGQVDIAETAIINGSLVAGAGNLRVGGPIGKGAHIGGGQVVVSNNINGDVFVGGEKIRFSQNAKVLGNLTYWSKDKIQSLNDAQVTGNVVQKQPPDFDKVKDGSKITAGSFKIAGGIIGLITTIIFGLLFIYLMPNYTNKATEIIRSKFWKSLGVGVLMTILIPILFVILLITVIGIPFSLLLLFVYIIFAYFAKIFVSLALGKKLFKHLSLSKISTSWIFITGLIIYYLISFIPGLGGLFSFIVMLTGIGALFMLERDYFMLLRKKKII